MALSVGLDDVDPVREPIEQCAREPFVAEDLHPCFEEKVCDNDKVVAYMVPIGNP